MINDVLLLIIGLLLTYLIVRFTIEGVLNLFSPRHKTVILFQAIYILLLGGLITAFLYISPLPRQLLHTVYQASESIIITLAKQGEKTVTSLAEQIGKQLEDAPSISEISSSFVNQKDIFCIANPGQEFDAVVLRDRPWWASNDGTDVYDKGYTSPRGTQLRIQGKIVNKDGIWFEILANDGSKRYVNATICSTSTDIDSIPIIPAGSTLPPLSQ